MKVEEGRLVRGDFTFRTMVLPALDILSLESAQKIVDFARAGGRVFALGELPVASAEKGMDDARMKELMETLRSQPTFTVCPASGLKTLFEGTGEASGLDSPIEFKSGAFPLLQHRRRIDGRDFFWLANNAATWQTCEVAVRGVRGAASIWDCETGGIRPVPSTDSDEGSALALVFKPYEAYWLVFDPEEKAHSGPAERKPEFEVFAAIEGTWKVSFDPGVQPVMEFSLTPPAEFAQGVEKPLEDWSVWGLQKFSGLLDYSMAITLEEPEKGMSLDLGQVCHVAEVWVNGKSCGARLWGPHVFDIGEALRPGRNEVRVRVANLINNSYGEYTESGLLGPVRILRLR